MKRAHKYLPIFPVLFAYGALLGYGLFFPGKWQLVSQLAFYCTLGQAFNLFMGMTGYVDFGYVAFMGVGTYGMAISIAWSTPTSLPAAPNMAQMAMFSWTVADAKGLGIWKVLPIPR